MFTKDIKLLGKTQGKMDDLVKEKYAQKIFEQLQDISSGIFSWDTDKVAKLAKLFKDVQKVSKYKPSPETCVKNTEVVNKEVGTWNIFLFKNPYYPVYIPDFEWYVVTVLQMLHDDFKMKKIYTIFNEYQTEMNNTYQAYRVMQLQKYSSCIEGNKARLNSKDLKVVCSEFIPYTKKNAGYLYMAQFFALFVDTIIITLARMNNDVSSHFGTPTLDKLNSSRWMFTTDCKISAKWPTVEEGTIGYTKKQPSQTDDALALNTMNLDDDNDVEELDTRLSNMVGTPTSLSGDSAISNVSPSSSNSSYLQLNPFPRSLSQDSELKNKIQQGGCGCMAQYGGRRQVVRRRTIRKRKSTVRRRKSSVRKRKSTVRRRKSFHRKNY